MGHLQTGRPVPGAALRAVCCLDLAGKSPPHNYGKACCQGNCCHADPGSSDWLAGRHSDHSCLAGNHHHHDTWKLQRKKLKTNYLLERKEWCKLLSSIYSSWNSLELFCFIFLCVVKGLPVVLWGWSPKTVILWAPVAVVQAITISVVWVTHLWFWWTILETVVHWLTIPEQKKNK